MPYRIFTWCIATHEIPVHITSRPLEIWALENIVFVLHFLNLKLTLGYTVCFLGWFNPYISSVLPPNLGLSWSVENFEGTHISKKNVLLGIKKGNKLLPLIFTKSFLRDFNLAETEQVTKGPTFPTSKALSLPWTHPTLPSQDDDERIVIKLWHQWKGEKVESHN